ncbi:pyroglutamyl-peptidase I [Microbacterium koreense]|uniref:Pyroglutamyl-peptidase I n=1 Tax=Microbacterium koreense TaxID=323761 RepID=A0ABW2ZTT2_9MICO
MTTVVLTGFEPFGGDTSNPSGAAIDLVASRWAGPATLVTAVLPVTFDGAAAQLSDLIRDHSPDLVIAVGLAGGRRAISIERIAVNLVDARIPDNAGAQPIDEPSLVGAPDARFSTLPVKAIARAVTDAGIPAELSHSAGTFVCNHVFFHALARAAHGTRAGFIHVPWDTANAPSGAPSLPISDIATALDIAIRTSLASPTDIRAVGGAVS